MGELVRYNRNFQDRCDICGRFVSLGSPGVSWSTQWGYDMSGTPDLHDPTFRCSPCTDLHGVEPTNCVGENWAGRNPKDTPNG